MHRSEIGVGLMGLGVVGSGVAHALLTKSDVIAGMAGCPVSLKHVLVRDLARTRTVPVPRHLLTTEAGDLLDDPEVAVVIEVMGGQEPAHQHICQALAKGKHVVTANKLVMAKFGPELMEVAEKHECNLLFEASVGGGIPIIAPLTRDLLANDVKAIHAIINGTTNYILTRMALDGTSFDLALHEAQRYGYAEADPSSDLEGEDAAYKLAILASLAFHTRVSASDIYYEGIMGLEVPDFRFAQELGYAIKLLAIARLQDQTVQARVHPVFVPLGHLLAKVDWAFNAIEVEGDLVGRVVFHGAGAGREPTTSAVLSDLLDISRRLNNGSGLSPRIQLNGRLAVAPMSSLSSKYYLRLRIMDRAGVLAQIAKVLGDANISIEAVLQKDSDLDNQTAEIVIKTYHAQEASMQQSMDRLRGLEVVREICSMVRIEDLASLA